MVENICYHSSHLFEGLIPGKINYSAKKISSYVFAYIFMLNFVLKASSFSKQLSFYFIYFTFIQMAQSFLAELRRVFCFCFAFCLFFVVKIVSFYAQNLFTLGRQIFALVKFSESDKEGFSAT